VLGGHSQDTLEERVVVPYLSGQIPHQHTTTHKCLAKQLDTEKKLAEVLETQAAMQT
jgi:hypothetical protein